MSVAPDRAWWPGVKLEEQYEAPNPGIIHHPTNLHYTALGASEVPSTGQIVKVRPSTSPPPMIIHSPTEEHLRSIFPITTLSWLYAVVPLVDCGRGRSDCH